MTREEYVDYNEDEEGLLTEPLYVPMVYSIGAPNPMTQPPQPLLQQSHIRYATTQQKPRQSTLHNKNVKEPTAPAFVSMYPEASAPAYDNGNEEDYVIHTINFTIDTITSIALQYGVTEEDIKRLNRLSDLDIYEGSTLVIPKSSIETVRNLIDEEALRLNAEERKQKALLRQFVKMFKAGYDEARYYLSSNDWNMHEACEEYKEDLKWEKENKVADIVEKHNPTKQ